MYYLPKLLAEKFAYFNKFSILSIWAISFISMVLFAFIASVIASLNELLVAPAFSIYLLFILGMISAKFFSRKKVILTGPVAVKIAATDAGESVAKVGKTLSEIVFLLLFYFFLFGCVFFVLSPLLLLANT
ncbi:hypothetical protein [Vibrio splendidus]|uniref:hypothetical protein n=1 Tax=Vibrio splendidus TaxID=29497 RepID=UPI000C84696B|nr:hypothetical protein [Vibrio splendidus]MCQ8868466.1 hypothetical protein [Vibrio splendidus]PMH69768.1 hypothetical protein BCU61_01420 [Vibrio splendidus]PMJ30467.1 hypothetical protein BCU26_12860 [Vibrio splendidus]